MLTRRRFMTAAFFLSLLGGTKLAGASWSGVSSANHPDLTLLDVRQYGVRGDGVTDDTAGIMRALTALITAGGGILSFPAGTFLLGEHNSSNTAVFVANTANIHLRGAGRGASILKLKNAGNAMVVGFRNVKDCSIEGFTIDGNRASQSQGVHGIASHNGATRLTIRDMHIKDCAHYGIGFQSGTLDTVLIQGVHIENTGADGIDLKNKNNNNQRIFISDVAVERPGRTSNTQSGIGIRGPAHLSNIHVSGLDRDQRGIEFEEGETSTVNGLGGHQSTLTNFQVYGTGASTFGVYSVARNVHISNGYVEGCQIGVLISDSRNKLANVTVQGCRDDGIRLNNKADGCSIVGCNILGSRGGAGRGIRVETDNTTVSASVISGCAGTGIQLTSTADGTSVENCVLEGNSPNVNWSAGTNSQFRNNRGFKTEADLESGTIAIDSPGVKTVSLAHGLSVRPAPHECHVTLLQDTNVTNFAVGWIRIRSTDATNVVVQMNITTPCSTPGARAKLAVRIRTC